MEPSIIITLISEAVTLAGVIITCLLTNSKTLYRIEQLEKKQDKYNNLQARMYECEKDIAVLQEDLKN
jgi:peptidoglycan hydrolase CwlO-like protein